MSKIGLHTLVSNISVNDYNGKYLESFLLGDKGSVLYFAETKKSERLQKMVGKLLEREFADFSFLNGIAGDYFLLSYLYKEKGIIGKEDLESFREGDTSLLSYALSLRNDDFDYLFGSLGIAYYSIYLDDYIDNVFVKSYINKISLSIDNILNTKDVNFGIAHGILSIMKFLIQCYKKDISKKEVKKLLCKIVGYIDPYFKKDRFDGSIIPQIISKSVVQYNPRLTWCYGDLIYAYIFYQAYEVFGDLSFKEKSIVLANNSMKKTTLDSMNVHEACFCHGTSSVFYLYYKMYMKTHENKYKDQAIHWLNVTLNLSEKKEGKYCFKYYDGESKKFANDSSILLGSIGVALSVNSLLTKDFSWDYCLMLND